MIVGENPPEGAILDYYLAVAGDRARDADDHATAPARSSANSRASRRRRTRPWPNVPEYWLLPPTVLPATAGMHRINWDLRYPDPPTLNYGYYGTLLDYREYTLSWHAIPGQTPRSTLVGPMVLPGTYTATLTVNGQKLSRSRSRSSRIRASPCRRPRSPRSSGCSSGWSRASRATYERCTYLHDVRAALTPKAREAIGASPTRRGRCRRSTRRWRRSRPVPTASASRTATSAGG